jgi:serine/threonine protein kinase/tetratricopeptide (TPR) repeat protein
MGEADGLPKNRNAETIESGVPAGSAPDATFDTSAAAALTAERAAQLKSIGPYQLIRKLGEGGMGQVWLAEQTEPIQRQVALKLIRVGRYDDSVLQRFYAERQSLAIMDHPSIAKVFDAGATADGQPYFVMEYVPGQPITTYCDRQRLGIRDRLELFVKVCEAVQHAHQKAVMHRDLKPANILVVEVDGKPVPRIIDFGLAKPASPKLDGQTFITHAGGWVGTPGYMSPEQADPGVMDVDTRTDVYSLGAVLYELLTGFVPFETRDWRKQRFDEFVRQLREEDPPRPSAKASTQEKASKSAAEARAVEPKQLVSQLHGDLDWITMKALEKDRARRYGSPVELAADIGRYLGNEPVTARPASVGYRARKYLLRHKALVAGTAAVFLVLVAGVITSTWQAVKARRAEAQAKQQSAIAQAVSDFLQHDLLAQASAAAQSPNTKLDPDLKVRTALDRAAQRIGGKFAKQPEVEAAIRTTIGQTYTELGLYPEAGQQLERALDLRRQTLGPDHPDTLKSMHSLATVFYSQGKYAQAEALGSQTLEIRRRVLGSEHLDTLKSMHSLAIVYWYEAKFPQAEALDSQILEIRRRLLGPEHPDTLSTMQNLALVYSAEGKYPQAEALHSQALEIRRRVSGPEHPDTLKTMNSLAVVYDDEGKYAQAEALHSQILEIRRRVLGPEHPLTLMTMANLASVYDDEGKYPQAEALDRQTLEIDRRVLGPEHPDTLRSMMNLAIIYGDQAKYAQAEALQSQTLEIRRRVLGPEHPDTLWSMNTLAKVYEDEGRYAQAEALFTQTLEIRRRVLGPEHPDTLNSVNSLAVDYQKQRKYALAETYAAQALAGRQHALGPEHPDTMAAEADLALAYLSQEKFTESEPLAREATEVDQKKQPDDWQRFRAESLLGAALAGQKKYAEAEPLLLEGYQGMMARKERMAVADRYHLVRAREWIVQLYKDWGKPEKAAEVAKESN